MHIIIGEKRCPNCGVQGKRWKKEPEVFICPTCSSFFNEFGFVVEPQIEREEESFT